MAEHSRYSVTNKKAGIKDSVLQNKLGISNQKELNDAEAILFSDAYEFFLSQINKNKIVFDTKFLFTVHKYFLGVLYDFAGKTREVDISKGSMMFASVKHLNSTLVDFDKVLKTNIPKNKDTKKIIANKIAIIHNEFNAIHPFREGNGRTIRLFIDLIIFDLGYQIIDWSSKEKNAYLKACIFGAKGDNKLMSNFLYKRLKKY